MKGVTQFLISMLSSNSGVSSKRFMTFITLINILVLTYIATFNAPQFQCPDFMYESLCLLSGGGMASTLIEKFSKQNAKNDQ